MAYGDYLEKISKYPSTPSHVTQFFFLELFVPIPNNVNYLGDGIRNGEWGDHVTLQAAADSVCFCNLSINLLCF